MDRFGYEAVAPRSGSSRPAPLRPWFRGSWGSVRPVRSPPVPPCPASSASKSARRSESGIARFGTSRTVLEEVRVGSDRAGHWADVHDSLICDVDDDRDRPRRSQADESTDPTIVTSRPPQPVDAQPAISSAPPH